jgi:glutathione S-transferase
MTSPALIVYGHPLSGHVHRVELFLSLLGLPFERRHVELMRGEQRLPEFLALNPLGQLPVLDDKGFILADSNAILVYLAKQYGDGSWMPSDPVGAARLQRWLSIANGELVQGPAMARVALIFGRGEAAPHQKQALRLLAMLEAHLQDKAFLLGDQRTLADIAHYSYIALAPEGGLSLADYPAVCAWLERLEALPGFLPKPVASAFFAGLKQ